MGAAEHAGLEIACLCNLAFAYIKLGSMEQAEEVCCVALHRRPECTKALFRRGQARLALGRLKEAALDFREVAIQEPTNAKITSIIGRVEEEINRAVLAGTADKPNQQQQDGRYPGGPPSKISLSKTAIIEVKAIEKDGNCVEKSLTRTDTLTKSLTTSGCCGNAGAKSKKLQTGFTTRERPKSPIPTVGTIERSNTAPPNEGTSTFMVSDWLNSAQRKRVDHKNSDGDNSFSIYPPLDIASKMSEKVKTRPICHGDMAVSKLVSQLTVKNKSKTGESPDEIGITVAQSEWSQLDAIESDKIKVFQRRSEVSQAEKNIKVVSRRLDGEREIVHGKKNGRKPSREDAPGSEKVLKALEWASLEAEEKKVRDSFRAKLRGKKIGKGEGKQRRKKKTSVSRLRTEVPP